MQAPTLPNKRFIIFLGNSSLTLHYESFGTFLEAWKALHSLVEDMKTKGSRITMLHSSPKLCEESNPNGMGGNTFIREWEACSYSNSECFDTRRVMGSGCIKEMQW